MPVIPLALLEEYERYAERADAVEQAFRPRARAAVMREYPDVALIISDTDSRFMGYSESRKTFISGEILHFPRWQASDTEHELRSVLLNGKLLRQRIEAQKAAPTEGDWNAFHLNGFTFERIGAERLLMGTMYLNNVVIAQSESRSKLEIGGFRRCFTDTVRHKLNLSGLDGTFVELQVSYLMMCQFGEANFIQRVEMPGHDFSQSIHLDDVAETFIDACAPLLSFIGRIEGRFLADSSDICDRYNATGQDYEELGFV